MKPIQPKKEKILTVENSFVQQRSLKLLRFQMKKIKTKTFMVYNTAIDEFRDIFNGPLLLILVSLTFSFVTGDKSFIKETIGTLIPTSLYIISSIVYWYYLIPKLRMNNKRREKTSIIKRLEFSMGFVRAFTAFCMLIMGFLILNINHPNFPPLSIYYMSWITLFLLCVNIRNKVLINNYNCK